MIVDGWVNLFPEAFAAKWAAQDEQQGVVAALRRRPRQGAARSRGCSAAMDDAGVDLGVLTAGLSDPERAHRVGGYAAEDFLAIAERAPRAASSCRPPSTGPPSRVATAPRVRELAAARRGRAGAGHAAGRAVRAQPPPLLPRVRHVRGARPAGVDQRRHPRPAGALALPGPGAARGRAHRLPRPHRRRRPHGPPLRGAADPVHAQVAAAAPDDVGLPGHLHGPGAGAVHGLVPRPGPGAGSRPTTR